MSKIIIERIGPQQEYCSNEFELTFSDGFKTRVWSEPLHGMSFIKEEKYVLDWASRRFRYKIHDLGVPKVD